MKNFILPILTVVAISYSTAQTEKEKVERACLDYIEGFYEGDTVKLSRTLKPSLHKIGFWKKADSYDYAGQMTYREAINYALNVAAKKNFAKPDSPKKVEVIDILENIASAKVTAWWGYDYILLSKQNDKWMIEEVLWEGPYRKPK
jgi:hypothetical protein